MDKDLFGNVPTEDLFNKVAVRYKGRGNAHPYPPGTGPKGETCGTCRMCVKNPYRDRNYYKCRYLKFRWTCGQGTDLRLKDEACFLWKKKDE